MPFPSDIILDRQKLKTQMTKWRIATVLLVCAVAMIQLKDSSFFKNANEFIARITINEEITQNPEYEKTISKLAADKSAKAVILHIDSPGGTEVGSEIIYRALLEMSKEKPLVVVMGTIAASGGYMISLAADQIFAHHGTLTGSIGVIVQSYEVTELIDKLGIKFNNFKSSELKGSPSPFEHLNPNVKAMMDDLIADSYNHFVDLIAERRNLPRETVAKLADGRVYSGKQAVANKLIDAIGGEKEAIDWLSKNKDINAKLPIIDVPFAPRKNLLESFFGYVDNKVKMKFNAAKKQLSPAIMTIWQ